MSWVAIIMDLDDNKVKEDWFYLKKIVFDTVRGDQLLCILLEVDYKYSSNCYIVSFSILRSPSFRVFFLFYTTFLLSSYPPRVGQIVGVDHCPISTFLKSLVVAVRLKITVQVSLPHKCGQLVRCRAFNAVVTAFFLDILGFPSILCFCDTYLHQQNLLECCLGWQTTSSDLGFDQPRSHSSSNHPYGLL